MLKALTLEVIRCQKKDAMLRREKLAAEIAQIDQEIKDCEASERMFIRVNETIRADIPIPTFAAPSLFATKEIGPYRINTTKYYIWQCLRYSQSRWLTAVEIRSIASNAKREEIPMSSISPMLNAMMKQGHVVRDGLKVALKERVESKNPATEAAGS